MRWLSFLVGFACSIGAAVAIYVAATPSPPPVPGVYAAVRTLEFGELSQGDKVTGEFKLTNRYPAPITILDVLAGCSCTEATPSVKTVPPGGSFTVSLKWAIGFRRGQLLDTVNVHYETAAGTRHMAELGMAAHVTPDIEYAPTMLTFAADKPGTAVVKFMPGKKSAFVLKSASVDQRAFTATIDAAKQEVTVTFDPAKGWTGIGSSVYLTLTTDSEHEPELRLPVRMLERS